MSVLSMLPENAQSRFSTTNIDEPIATINLQRKTHIPQIEEDLMLQ
jgi:hypothetical protein